MIKVNQQFVSVHYIFDSKHQVFIQVNVSIFLNFTIKLNIADFKDNQASDLFFVVVLKKFILGYTIILNLRNVFSEFSVNSLTNFMNYQCLS